MSTARADAKRLLTHYIQFAALQRLTSDNQAEIADIVDLIIDAACDAVVERMRLGIDARKHTGR